MIGFIAVTALLLLYGIRKKCDLRLLIIGGLLFILSIAAAILWYTPIHLQVSDMEQIRVRLEVHDREIQLDDQESKQLINLFKECKLYRGGCKPALFADQTTSIRFFGKGLGKDCNPASFYILDDRPQLSFADINGRKYKIKNVGVFQEFLQKKLIE